MVSDDNKLPNGIVKISKADKNIDISSIFSKTEYRDRQYSKKNSTGMILIAILLAGGHVTPARFQGIHKIDHNADDNFPFLYVVRGF